MEFFQKTEMKSGRHLFQINNELFMEILFRNKKGFLGHLSLSEIVNFMNPGAGVLMLGRGEIRHYSEYVVSSTLSIYSTLIAIVLRDYDAEILYHC